MTAVVNYSQRLLTGISVGIDSFLVTKKDPFDGGNVKVGLLNDIKVSVEAVSFDVLTEDFHVL